MVEATAVVSASAGDVLDFVMDLDRYRQADHKIRRIRHMERHGDVVVASMWTRFRGMPVAATQRLTLTPGQRIDVVNEPSWQDRFTLFHGEFICLPATDGTQVTHRYTFTFRGAARLMTPILRGWFARDIGQEVARLKAILDAPNSGADPP